MNAIKLYLVAFMLIAGLAYMPAEAKSQQVQVNLSVFQRDLGRYGKWMHSPKYGQIWIYNEPGFRPYYTNGSWEYTNYGWAWVSNYDWGWAPFHYGRWELDPYYGWIWIPGYDWAPAWVTWSQYDGYYGWAPLGFGISLNVSFGNIPYNRWMFVPRQDICRPDLHRYSRNLGASRVRNAVIINNIYVNNTTNVRFAQGPQRRDVERYTRTTIQPRTIEYGRPQRAIAENNSRPQDNRNGVIQRPSRAGAITPENPGSNPVIDRPDNSRPVITRPSNNLPERRPVTDLPGRSPVMERPDHSNPVTRPSNNLPQRRPVADLPARSPVMDRPGNSSPVTRPSNNLPQRRPVTDLPGRSPVMERSDNARLITRPSNNMPQRPAASQGIPVRERPTSHTGSRPGNTRQGPVNSGGTVQRRPSSMERNPVRTPRVERSSPAVRENSSPTRPHQSGNTRRPARG